VYTIETRRERMNKYGGETSERDEGIWREQNRHKLVSYMER
jgi:hypothetical protein